MKCSLFSIFLFSLVLSGMAQEKIIHDRNAQERELPSFHSIVAYGSANIYLTQGPRKVAVSAADPEDVAAIETVVENGVLKIRVKTEQRWWKAGKMYDRRFTVFVSEEAVQSVVLSGSGKLHVDMPSKAEELSVRLSGSGNVTGNVQLRTLKCILNGSGNIRLTGSCDKARFVTSGSGNIQVANLQLDYCTLEMSGSGNADVHVRKELDATISGPGNIRYKGDGKLVRAQSSGSGRIQKVGS
jgi:hypothetical protein